jgi:hypothetical protein
MITMLLLFVSGALIGWWRGYDRGFDKGWDHGWAHGARLHEKCVKTPIHSSHHIPTVEECERHGSGWCPECQSDGQPYCVTCRQKGLALALSCRGYPRWNSSLRASCSLRAIRQWPSLSHVQNAARRIVRASDPEPFR